MKNILIKFPGEALSLAQTQSLLALAGIQAPGVSIDVCHALDATETYVYAQIPLSTPPAQLQDLFDQRKKIQGALAVKHPSVLVVDLQCTLDVAGYSADKAGGWHYVVETDVRPGGEDDFEAWYCTEHLPGLAAVPGTVRARRYISAQTAPRHYATYDLATLETYGSTPWIAVRDTSWSSRVRPTFFNTKRTMFRHVESTS